jgi:threonine 3-dehydrogenase
MVLRDYSRLVMNGVALHSVVGRRIFATWNITKSLLEDRNNGIQDAIWEIILNRGEGTLVDLADWDAGAFELTISEYTKPVLRIGGEPLSS